MIELPLDASAATRPSLLTTFLPTLARRLVAKARPASHGVATNGVESSTEAADDGPMPEDGVDDVPAVVEQAAKGNAKKRKGKQRR